MGAVYRATDTVFGREVAVKLLLEKYTPLSGTAHRFHDEARITGQLQHPGIPPVHDLGTLPDGRQFLVMKLIKGETLDELLKGQPDRGRLVAVFEQVCQAVAYAHAHDVIHRDLKPANVMVGSFGEVQVMDWGLAKVLTDPRSAPAEDPLATTGLTEVKSLRDSDELLTQAGSVLGTPAYMPPEQALGAVHEIDRRSDVFGLGGILAAILTGRPPFVGETAEITRVQSAKGKVGDCFTRLDGCCADPELVALCKRCLAPEKDDRPADAGAVAEAVAALRQAADERARQAELDRARAESQAIEQRKRRRMVQLTGGIVAGTLLAGIIGTTIGFYQANEQRRTAEGQRDEIAEREREVARLKKIAEDRLRVYQKAVDQFVNEAPSIVDGHPLGSAPARDLLELCGKLLEEVQGTGVDDTGLAVRGQMSAIIRKGHLAKTEGRIDDAEKHYNDAFKLGKELLRTTTPEEKGKNTGNLALISSLRATILRSRAEIQAGFLSSKEKSRAMFAEAVKLHEESIALSRRVVTEPDMRDIHVAEAEAWLAGGYYDLAETHRRSVAAAEDEGGQRSAYESTRAASLKAEEHYAVWEASGWRERNTERTRLRQALAMWEHAKAAEKLARNDEADAAYQKAFDLLRELVRDTPKNLLHRIHFSSMAVEQGDFLMLKRKDPKRAGVAYAAATEQTRRLGKPPELRAYSDSIGANLYRQGIASLGAGDPAKARDLFVESVAYRQEQLRESIRIGGKDSHYTDQSRTRLMFSQARAGDHTSAAAWAESLRKKYPKDARQLNYAAQGFAICSLVANKAEEKAAYRDDAFKCLTGALDAGYADADEMMNDPDYSALRDDPRFPPLLARAKAPKPPEAPPPREKK